MMVPAVTRAEMHHIVALAAFGRLSQKALREGFGIHRARAKQLLTENTSRRDVRLMRDVIDRDMLGIRRKRKMVS